MVSAKHFVQIGKRRFPFTTYQQASEAYRAMIDKTGVGASRAPRADIVDRDGNIVARISYNGRIWALGWQPGTKPIYDNRT